MRIATREKILEAACRLFYERGFHEIGVDVIAKHARMTRQTLYNYFESKEAIILGILLQQDHWRRQAIAQKIGDSGRHPENQLRAACSALLEVLGVARWDGRLFLCAASTFLCPHDPIRQVVREHTCAIRKMISKTAARAGVRDPDLFAVLFQAIVEGAATTDVIDGDGMAAETAGTLANLLIDNHLRRNRAERFQGAAERDFKSCKPTVSVSSNAETLDRPAKSPK